MSGKGGLSKKAKNIIILSAAAVVLGALAAVLILTSPKEEEEETPKTEDTSVVLYSRTTDEVKSVHIKNSLSEYTIVKDGEEWTIEGEEYRDLPKNTTIIDTIPKNAAAVTAKALIDENAADLAMYGLEDGQAAEVTVNFTDGEKRELLIGDISPKAAQSYIRFKGENAVYTVSTNSVDAYRQDNFNCLSKIVLLEPAQEDYPRVDKVSVSRAGLDYNITVEYDERNNSDDYVAGSTAAHTLTEPVNLQLNLDKSVDFTFGMFGLTATAIDTLHPTEEELTEKGLTEPFCTVKMDTSAGSYTLKIGMPVKDESGAVYGFYCYLDGVDMVYIIPGESLPWVSIMPLDITLSIACSVYIYDIAEIDVTAGEREYHFVLDSEDKTMNSVTLNGKVIENNRFKTMYQYIIKTPAEELYLEPVETKPEVYFTLKLKDGGERKFEFAAISDRRAAIIIDGVPSLVTRSTYVDVLKSNLDKLENGGELVLNW